MTRTELRAATAVADLTHAIHQQRLATAWQPWQRRLRANKTLVVVGGSFATGLLLARSPGRLLMRGLGAVAGIASLMLRTPLGSLMIASVATARSTAAELPSSITKKAD